MSFLKVIDIFKSSGSTFGSQVIIVAVLTKFGAFLFSDNVASSRQMYTISFSLPKSLSNKFYTYKKASIYNVDKKQFLIYLHRSFGIKEARTKISIPSIAVNENDSARLKF